MKVQHYKWLMAAQTSRRAVLKGAASAGALALASGGALGALTRAASAQDNLRAEILKIPGVGKGSPTDADWQKVGEMCLGATKANVAEGEFAGVELTFMGLNNQNLHNLLFRGFLKSWETYTGAKINWIDLAQADYNARLQQSIATGTVDFDIIEMGAPFEGDTAGKGLLDEMPDWVKTQIDADDLVGYLKPPVGTWDGKTYRITIDGDCHTFAYRKDYLTDAAISGATGMTEAPTTWDQVNEFSKKVVGQTDPLTGLAAYGFLDPLKYQWGGFGFYFLEDRAAAYAKHPGDPAWLFDPDTMKPLVNNPAWVQAIQDVMDLVATKGAYPADQVNTDPNGTAFQQFLAGTGGMLTWWGDVGSTGPHVRQLHRRRRRRFLDQSRRHQGLQRQVRRMGGAGGRRQLRSEHGLSRLGRLRDEPGLERREEAQGRLVRRGTPRRQGPLALDGCLPLGLPALSAVPLQLRRVGGRGYDRAFVEDYLGSNLDSYNHPNAAIEPRIPGIFQYYSIAEDELVKGINGQYKSAQETADAIAAAWEKITDQIGRDSQIKLYKSSLGMS